MNVNARTVAWLLSGWTALWFTAMAWHGGLAWHFFVQGAQALADADDPAGGLHLYAVAPVLQIGPLAFLVTAGLRTLHGRPDLLAAQVLGAAGGAYILWQASHLAQRFSPWAVVFFTPVWMYLAVASAHLDDVLALVAALAALAAARAGRSALAGLLLGLSIDAKPWALGIAALLLILPGWRAVIRGGLTTAITVAAGWLPFFLADPRTARILHFTIANTSLSALRALGVTDPHTPAWDRPAQALLGTGLGLLAVRRGRWPAVLLLAVAARIALDPGTNKYYAAGAATGAVLWDLAGTRNRFPWWSAGAAGTLFASRWIPMPAAVHGWTTLAYCVCCLTLLIPDGRASNSIRHAARERIHRAGEAIRRSCADARTPAAYGRLRRVAPGLVPGILMLVIGLVGASRAVLSWDEVATADVARRSPGQIWHLAQTVDGVFEPYYLLMHCWTAIAGSSVLDLRLPSIVAMAGAAAATGELGRQRFGTATGLLAGLLFCLIPNTSRYAQEARPYAFACLFSVVALILLNRVLDRPRPARWIAYGFVIVLLGLAHLVALVVIGAHLAIVVIRARLTLAWATTVTAALVLLMPIAWLGLRERNAQLSWVPPISARQIYAFPAAVVGSTAAAWLLLGLVTIAVWQPTRLLAEMLAAVMVPLATVGAVSVLGPSFWVARYLLIILPPTAILTAAGLIRLAAAEWRGIRPGAAVPIARLLTVCVLFGLAVVPGQVSVRGRTAKNGSDWRSAAAIIRRYQQPGDGIVYTPRSRTLRAGTDYYLRNDPGRPRDVLLLRSAAAAGDLRATEYAGVAATARSAPRMWLFVAGRHNDPTAIRTDLRPLLRQQYVRVRLWQVKRATLALFTRR